MLMLVVDNDGGVAVDNGDQLVQLVICLIVYLVIYLS